MPQTSTLKTPLQQILLRIPEDLSKRFAQIVPQRQRSSYILNLLRSALDRESLALEQAAQSLTAYEARLTNQHLVREETELWLDSPLTQKESVEDAKFDTAAFERDFATAQRKLQKTLQE